jgi:hypothetical protein
VFDQQERTGEDADGNPIEDEWIYRACNDPDQARAELVTSIKPAKRGATRKNPTYYYKPVSLNRWELAAEEDDD